MAIGLDEDVDSTPYIYIYYYSNNVSTSNRGWRGWVNLLIDLGSPVVMDTLL